ncbi:hypothetical protein GTA51_15775 [Desulfovibrio aerotolerans]|uniref:Uncharacterized protein n=1 Tax=Solidesulfovibrio aerotolerans TaxID=295255 RepID=A0A7C9IV90_9BACT|nr:hypothetical protein [Solidesulfovibrio aerotolerans]MYL84580.1 hypothetical protein [Solidesulfovibrio aerotolerans]
MASAKLITSEVVRHTPWPMLGFVHELTVENRKLRLEIEALQAKLNQNSIRIPAIPISLETKGRLWRHLHERGIVLSSNPDRIGTLKFVNGIHHRVLHLDFSECFKDTFRRRGEGAENGQENNIYCS